MNLRARLLTGYLYLLLLLLAGAVVALFHVGRLGSGIGQILDENYASVEASDRMLSAMSAEQTQVLSHLAQLLQSGDMDRAADFEAALSTARQNITIDGEGEVLERIALARESLTTSTEVLAKAEIDDDARRYFEARYTPDYARLASEVRALRRLNVEAMREAESRASDLARQAAIAISTLSVLGLLSVLLLARGLRVRVVDRLGDLTSFAEAVAAGELERRGDALVDDEFGAITESLNAVLDRHQSLEAKLRGKLTERRASLVSLLHQYPRPCAMLGLDCELIASTLPADAEDRLRELEATLREAAEQLMEREVDSVEERTKLIPIDDEGKACLRLTALGMGEQRIFGWLAEFEKA